MEGARLEQRRSQALIKLLFKYGELNVIYIHTRIGGVRGCGYMDSCQTCGYAIQQDGSIQRRANR